MKAEWGVHKSQPPKAGGTYLREFPDIDGSEFLADGAKLVTPEGNQ